MGAYQQLRTACGVPADAFGRVAFDAVHTATGVSQVPHKTKSFIGYLASLWKLRPAVDTAPSVVISGAGPVGLRAAVECALMGMRVAVIEKREGFSRVNILLLWQQVLPHPHPNPSHPSTPIKPIPPIPPTPPTPPIQTYPTHPTHPIHPTHPHLHPI